ncbi:MAG TPA: O-antigen ligase family protein [Solirubrobacteraceae bacterium]|nr:O-antigen ligase family protein [Solirubrobacteraceae bacterium]
MSALAAVSYASTLPVPRALATSLPSAISLPSATSLPSAGTLAAGLAVALVVVAALAVLMRRRSEAFPLLAVLALPFRVPISSDGKSVNLLVPLYLVIAAGTLVYLLPRWLARTPDAVERAGAGRDPDAAAQAPASEPRPRLRTPSSWLTPRGLEWILLAAMALYVLQASYSSDRVKALENVAFFYVPFGLMFLILREVSWTRELLARCLGVSVALAVVFAGVGFVEYERKSLFLNPKVVAADQYSNYFRVNSVFFDPSIYGRFLALVMIAVMAAVLTAGRARAGGREPASRAAGRVLAGGAVLAWLLAGMVTSFSQSSIAALLLGLAVLGAWCWGARPTLALAGGLLALGLVFVALAPASLHFGLKGAKGSASNATSGRATLIEGGLKLFAARPLEGYGSGSFETEYKRHSVTDAENATSASHTVPVTVAAEQGLLGLGLYAALLVSAFAVLFAGARPSAPRMAIAACFAALVLHTWTYADFLEDPFTWALLAVGVALARQERLRPTSAARRAKALPQ